MRIHAYSFITPALLMVSPLFATENPPALSVPVGFESLIDGQEEQLEVRLAGRVLGLYSLEVKPETVRFNHPDRLFSALNGEQLEPEQQIQLKETLNAPLARNGQKACNGLDSAGCGYIATDKVAAILDESQGAILLFLNPAWLKSHQADNRYNTLTSEAVNAFVHRQSINVSSDSYSKNMSVSGAGALGLGENRYLGGDWALTMAETSKRHSSTFWFDNLYARQDLGHRYYLQGGRMDQRNLSSPLGGSFGFSLLPLERFNGVRVGTTSAYVNHSVSQDATPLVIQTNRNARVDIYRGSQLLGSQYFAPGINNINTSTFPPGSYPLELRVFENGVLQRTEQQPFTKSSGGFANGLQWFLQAGQRDTENGTHVQNKTVAAAGVQYVPLRDVQLTGGSALANKNLYHEMRIDAQRAMSLGVLSGAATGYIGNDGSRGNIQQLTFTDGFMLSMYRYNTSGSVCNKAGTHSVNNTGCYTSLNATLSVPFAGWTTTLGYTETRNKGRSYWINDPVDPLNPVQRYNAPGRTSQAWQLGTNKSVNWRGMNINGRLGVYRNDYGNQKDNGMFLGVSLSRASQPPSSSGHDSFSSVAVDYRSAKQDSQATYNLNHTMMWQQGLYRELGLNFSGDKNNNYTGGISGRVNGRYGDLNGTVSDSFTKGTGSHTSVTAGYASALAVSRHGIFMGGGGGGEPAAAVAVRVAPMEEGGKQDAAEIQGSSYRSLNLGFGDSALVVAEAYQYGQLDVRDVTNSGKRNSLANVAHGGGMRPYFLAPGHLLLREVGSSVTWIYLGRALGPDGRPLANAQVLNQPLPALGHDGRFTLQANRKVEALWLMADGQLMRCPLNVQRTRDVLKIVGDVRCTTAGVEGLPQSLKMTPRVMKLLALAKR
ncbi:fimbrial outer membrane usher protein TcfC [Shimwellia blattae]|nr:hypothetical protein EB105725_25_00250 [Shimwellia blattae DSM 4481 = NBRC 105725]VDY65926.1 fimbrial outer membrane usher protein TcfC [Shimwellia blattae]VEC26310.1 fimbrial outer membrane usher protein TcfC [Shimwellia blattae]